MDEDPGLRVFLLLGPAARLDQGAVSGALRADPGEGQDRPVRSRGRHVGRIGHQHARRRGHGPPVPGGKELLPGRVRGGMPGGLASGHLRLFGGHAADRQGRRQQVVPDPEDLLEPGQPDAAPHLQLGGNRRHPALHALPAGGQLQLGTQRPGTRPRRAELPGPRPGHRLAGPVRLRRRRRRTHPGDAGGGAPHRGPGGIAEGGTRIGRQFLRHGPRPSTRHCPSGSARCTSSCTAARTPARRKTKLGNRRSEHLLREAELWCATAAVRAGYVYPAAELKRLWRLVLLQQFHDILPGSSIAWVHQDAERNYAAVEPATGSDHRRRRRRGAGNRGHGLPAQRRAARA